MNTSKSVPGEVLVARFACILCGHFLQIGGQICLLKKSQADTSVDAALCVSQNALAARKVLRRKKNMGIIFQLLCESWP